MAIARLPQALQGGVDLAQLRLDLVGARSKSSSRSRRRARGRRAGRRPAARRREDAAAAFKLGVQRLLQAAAGQLQLSLQQRVLGGVRPVVMWGVSFRVHRADRGHAALRWVKAHAPGQSRAMSRHTVADFDFELPPELIAQHPAPERSASACWMAPAPPQWTGSFRRLPELLHAGDLLVFNDTRVIKARLYGVKATGGSVEGLVEVVLPGTQRDLEALRASKRQAPAAACALLTLSTPRCWAGAGRTTAFHLRLDGDPFELLSATAMCAAAALHHACRRGGRVRPTRPSLGSACPAPWPHDGLAALLTSWACSRRLRNAASRPRTRPCTSGPVPSSRCGWRTLPSFQMHSEWCEVSDGLALHR